MAITKRKLVSEAAPTPSKSGGRRSKRKLGDKKTHASPTDLSGEVGEVMREIATMKGDTGIIRMASDTRAEYGRVKSGILSLDIALGGGFKISRGSMIYGEKSTGKSTVSCKIIGNSQKANPDMIAIYVDVEGTYDSKWAKKLGVDLDRLIIIEPESGEEAVDLADAAFRANETSILVTDSIAMLTPMKELEESAEKSLPGIHARLIGNYLRRLNQAMLEERHRKHYPIVLHLNQFRMRIGVMFGDPRVLPGGKALEFCATQQVQMYNKEILKDSMVIHNDHTFKITKDKTGGKLKEGSFKLIRDEELTGLPVGYIDQAKSILSHGAKAGIVTGKYDVKEAGKFRSSDLFSKFLVENPKVEANLCDKIIAYYRKKWDIG